MSKVKIIPDLRFPEFENEGEWDKPKLSSVSDVIMGSSPSSLSYNENKIGLPLLQGNADIKNRLSTPRIYTTEITKECEIGDILLSVRAPVGTVAKSLHNACIGRGISALSAKKPNSQEYIYQWLFSYESSWAKISQGGTFDAVNSDDIKNLLVPIPKPKEQQKIASCLSSLDALITAQSEKIEQLKLHKKGLMQNLFPQEGEKVPKYRFKEFEKKWEKVKLKDVSTYFNGGSYENDVKEDGKYELITLKSINKYGQLVNSNRYIDIEVATLSIGTLVMILSEQAPGLLGMTAIIPENNKYVLNQRVAEIRPNQKVICFFLSMAINRNQVYFSKQGAGMKVQNITKPNVENYEFLVPEINEQQKIASCLSSLDALITAQAEKIEQLKLHKKGLMQGLFPKINE